MKTATEQRHPTGRARPAKGRLTWQSDGRRPGSRGEVRRQVSGRADRGGGSCESNQRATTRACRSKGQFDDPSEPMSAAVVHVRNGSGERSTQSRVALFFLSVDGSLFEHASRAALAGTTARVTKREERKKKKKIGKEKKGGWIKMATGESCARSVGGWAGGASSARRMCDDAVDR